MNSLTPAEPLIICKLQVEGCKLKVGTFSRMIVNRFRVGLIPISRKSTSVLTSALLILASVAATGRPTPSRAAKLSTPLSPSGSGAGYAAWLRYDEVDEKTALSYEKLPAAIVALDDSIVVRSAEQELIGGVQRLLGRTLRMTAVLPDEDAIVLGKADSIRRAISGWTTPSDLKGDGYVVEALKGGGKSRLVITALNDRGGLYGAFALLRKIGLHQSVDGVKESQSPYAPVRMLDEWDNLDGTIERG